MHRSAKLKGKSVLIDLMCSSIFPPLCRLCSSPLVFFVSLFLSSADFQCFIISSSFPSSYYPLPSSGAMFALCFPRKPSLFNSLQWPAPKHLLPIPPKLTGVNRQIVAPSTLCTLWRSEAVRVLLAIGLLDINILELAKDLEVAEEEAEKHHKVELWSKGRMNSDLLLSAAGLQTKLSGNGSFCQQLYQLMLSCLMWFKVLASGIVRVYVSIGRGKNEG